MPNERKLACFTMEIGLQSDLPTYSGDMGLLAGDAVRSAADRAVARRIRSVDDIAYGRTTKTFPRVMLGHADRPRDRCETSVALLWVAGEARARIFAVGLHSPSGQQSASPTVVTP